MAADKIHHPPIYLIVVARYSADNKYDKTHHPLLQQSSLLQNLWQLCSIYFFRHIQFLSFCLALDDGNVDEAHHIHISLMVDFVAEVSNSCLLFVKSLVLWVVCKIIVNNNFNTIQKCYSEMMVG